MQAKKYCSDQELEAIFHELQKECPTVNCPSGKKITKLCTNSDCKNALRCSDFKCQSCGKGIHPLCSTVALEEVTEMLNQSVQKSKEFMVHAFEIDKKLIDVIQSSQKDMLTRYVQSVQKQQSMSGVKKLYKDKSYKSLSGMKAKELCQSLQQKCISGEERIKKLLTDYQKQVNTVLEELNKIKGQFLSEFMQESQMDSQILSPYLYGSEEQVRFLFQSLKNPKQLKLLFRASEHDFSASAFHSKCDNIEDTLTIAKTQFGKTIAGFSHYKWNKPNNGNRVDDKQRNAFLLQLDLKEKMVPVADQCLIVCHAQLGPVFGSGSDLLIADKCTSNNNSSANFPNGYNHEGTNKYVKGQESFKAFCGANKGFQFRVIQYEVFKVVYN